MLGHALGPQMTTITFKACHTAAVTNADGRMPCYEPNIAACQKVLWNLASHISGNFFSERSVQSWIYGELVTVQQRRLTLVPVILL